MINELKHIVFRIFKVSILIWRPFLFRSVSENASAKKKLPFLTEGIYMYTHVNVCGPSAVLCVFALIASMLNVIMQGGIINYASFS